MRITHIYGSLYRMHGATKWLLLFTTQLAQRGHASTLVCLNCSIPLPNWFRGAIQPLCRKQFSTLDFSGLRKLIFMGLQIIAMPLLAFKIPRDSDVIVYHGEHSLFTSFLSKILHRQADHIYYCYSSPRELFDLAAITKRTFGFWFVLLKPLLCIYKCIDRLLVRQMPTTLVWSREHEQFVSSIYGDLKYRIVPAGVDFSTFNKKPSTERQLDALREKRGFQGKNILLMNASLTAKKRIPMFLRLLRALTDKGYAVHGLIIGQGPEEYKLKALTASLRIGGNVTFLGFVTQEDLPLYYHLCDVLFYLEPRGVWTMSVIEAGAAGKPVIVAPGGSMPTLVSHRNTGFILNDLENENELWDYTTFLLDNPKARKEMGEKNFVHSKQFSVEKSVERFLEIIKQNF